MSNVRRIDPSPVSVTSPDLDPLPVCGESPAREPCHVCHELVLPALFLHADDYPICPVEAALACIERALVAYRADPEGWLKVHTSVRPDEDAAEVATDEASEPAEAGPETSSPSPEGEDGAAGAEEPGEGADAPAAQDDQTPPEPTGM